MLSNIIRSAENIQFLTTYLKPYISNWNPLHDKILLRIARLIADHNNVPYTALTQITTANSNICNAFQQVISHELTEEPRPAVAELQPKVAERQPEVAKELRPDEAEVQPKLAEPLTTQPDSLTGFSEPVAKPLSESVCIIANSRLRNRLNWPTPSEWEPDTPLPDGTLVSICIKKWGISANLQLVNPTCNIIHVSENSTIRECAVRCGTYYTAEELAKEVELALNLNSNRTYRVTTNGLRFTITVLSEDEVKLVFGDGSRYADQSIGRILGWPPITEAGKTEYCATADCNLIVDTAVIVKLCSLFDDSSAETILPSSIIEHWTPKTDAVELSADKSHISDVMIQRISIADHVLTPIRTPFKIQVCDINQSRILTDSWLEMQLK
jgi:hypothetical protein